jgi:LysM repeat protein
MMARYRQRRNAPRRWWVIGSAVTVAGILGYAQFISPVLEGSPESETVTEQVAGNAAGPPSTGPPSTGPQAPASANNPVTSAPRLTSTRPETPSPITNTRIAQKGARTESPRRDQPSAEDVTRRNQLLAAGQQALQRDDPVGARAHLSEAVRLGLADDDLVTARAALVRIGADSIFSGRIYPDDPLVGRHVVSPGESLGKIAKRYAVTSDLLAAINGIANKNMIRAGQTLKVVNGPFHARVDKRTFRMDIYLQDTFVRQYQVGLGANDSTPTGEWLVGTKLVNPTYYPPRGGRIISAGDPQNPLGEHWIELIGVSGAARGQSRYGIHGTIAPESIGKSESLGCIRLLNEDVAEVFTLLISKKSKVWVR